MVTRAEQFLLHYSVIRKKTEDLETMEKGSEIAGIEKDGDEDFDYEKSSPRLPVLSNPWGFHSESPGVTTPPLNSFSSSVPFDWEEVPGKPKHQQEEEDEYYLASPVSSWNDYQDNDVNKTFTKSKTKRAKRGFLVSLNLPNCMTRKAQQQENCDVRGREYKWDDSALRVIDGLVDAYTACPCPTFPTPTFFVTRRKRRGWVERKLCRSSSFVVSMWRRAKRVSLSRRKSPANGHTTQ